MVIRIRIEPIEESLRALQANLRASRKVVYVRFGDNDLFHMVGKDGRGRYLRRPIGRNKTAFSETLQSDLLQAIRVKHPFYMRAVGARWRVEPLMQGTFFAGNRVPKCLPRYIKKVLPRDRQFFHPVLFSYLACLEPEKWRSFCEEFLHPKRKIFVGSLDPDKLTPLGKFDGWVRTPYQNAPRYTAEAKKLLADQVRQGDMVILGCGQLSRVLAPWLWELEAEVQAIDIGSHIDAYVGRFTRRYLKRFGPCLHAEAAQFQLPRSPEEKPG